VGKLNDGGYAMNIYEMTVFQNGHYLYTTKRSGTGAGVALRRLFNACGLREPKRGIEFTIKIKQVIK